MTGTIVRKLFCCSYYSYNCDDDTDIGPVSVRRKVTKLGGNSLPQIPVFDESSRRISIYYEANIYKEGEHWRKMKEQILGCGHFGICYQALDVVTGILMAVKQVPITGLEAANTEDLKDEIEVLGRLNHSNIVRILGATQERTHINIFLEWMPGGSVSSLLAKFGPFHEYVIIRYIKQVLMGLEYLHANQLIHRDLKGANILVDGTGQRVRISDFGTVGCLNSPVTQTNEFQGQLAGTLPFMAPEVVRGTNYGRSSDIWSVGCVIIEMATAHLPWSSETTPITNYYQLFYLIGDTHEPPKIPTSLSNSTRSLAEKCLELNPKLRPSAERLLLLPLFLISPNIPIPTTYHVNNTSEGQSIPRTENFTQEPSPSPSPSPQPPSESDEESFNSGQSTPNSEDQRTTQHPNTSVPI